LARFFSPTTLKWSPRSLLVVAYGKLMAQVFKIFKLHTNEFLSIITFQIRFATVVYAPEKENQSLLSRLRPLTGNGTQPTEVPVLIYSQISRATI